MCVRCWGARALTEESSSKNTLAMVFWNTSQEVQASLLGRHTRITRLPHPCCRIDSIVDRANRHPKPEQSLLECRPPRT
jgi:hypothetical protein